MGLDEGVLEGGEGLEDEGVEATWRAAGAAEGGAEAQGADAAAGGGVGAVADVDGEEAHQKEGGYKNNYDDGHGGSEVV